MRTYWRDINPERGVFRWDLFDNAFKQAAQNSKKVRLLVAPGFYSPDFIHNNSAIKKAAFTVPQGPDSGKTKNLPLPWDETYLQEWFSFVDQLAARYRDNPAFAYVSATGPNSHNGEISLPREPNDEKVWASLGTPTELENRILGAYRKTFTHFCQSFAGKPFTIAIISESLPGQDKEVREHYSEALAQMGAEVCPSAFGLQNNGLDGRPVQADLKPMPAWELISSYGGKIFTGFQSRTRANLYHCKRSGRDCKGEKTDIFGQMLKNGISRHACFLELYEKDLSDPELEPLVTSAHTQLNQSSK